MIELEVLGASFCLWSASQEAMLAPFVAHVWASRGRPEFAAERVIPDGGSVLLFNLGRALEVRADGAHAVMRDAFFAGPAMRWADVHYGEDATHEQVGVLFQPGGAAAFFGRDAEALQDVVIEPSLLPEMRLDVARVGDALRGTTSLKARVQFLTAALRDGLRDTPLPITLRIMAMMRRHPTSTIKEHAARAGWTQQHLHRVLRRESGLGSKALQQVVRLQQTLGALERLRARPHETSLAQLAGSHGYVDQAHLTNTLRTMTGLTPRGLLALPPAAIGRVLYVVRP